jgi:hypothetical protein
MMKTYNDYIFTRKMQNIDLNMLRRDCGQMYDIISTKFTSEDGQHNGQSTMTTELYASYNLLLAPYEAFHDLHNEIKWMFNDINPAPEKYYIQCWLNYYQKGEFIDWHYHWPKEVNAYHGFVCVDTLESKTTYRMPETNEEVDIPSEDGIIVISKSAGDEHRTWPWENERPRVTIAFDIVPGKYLDPNKWLNHWIPL